MKKPAGCYLDNSRQREYRGCQSTFSPAVNRHGPV